MLQTHFLLALRTLRKNRVYAAINIFGLAGSAAISVAFLTVSFQSVKAALANPVKSLRSE